MVEGGGLENRRAQAPGVRIPLPPLSAPAGVAAAGWSPERGRGLWRAGRAALTVTPPAGAWLGGSGAAGQRPAAGRVGAPRRVRALALATRGRPLVWVSLEAGAVSAAWAAELSARVPEAELLVVPSGGAEVALLGDSADASGVQAAAAAAARLALGRLRPAEVGWGSAACQPDDDAAELLPYLDALTVETADGGLAVLVSAPWPVLQPAAEGGLGEFGPAALEAAVTAVTGRPATVLVLPRAGTAEPDAQPPGATSERLLGAVGAALLTALLGPREALLPVLGVRRDEVTLATQRLPDLNQVLAAAEAAELALDEGAPGEREATRVRLGWLRRLQQLAAAGRTGGVPVGLTEVRVGAVALWGVGAALSTATAQALLARQAAPGGWAVSCLGGRTAAILARPGGATLAGGPGLEPLCDLWPLAPGAVTALGDAWCD